LTNYLSGIDYPDGENAKFWPTNVHIIGKDISWFHCVIWPSMLMSCNIPLPKTVFCHGFVNASDGRKMSKSYGNVVTPLEALNLIKAPNQAPDHVPSSDAFRYFCMREGVAGGDLSYNPKSFIARHDAELQATLGNLANRGLTLAKSVCGGKVPNVPPHILFDVVQLKDKINEAFDNFQIQIAVELAFEQLRLLNNWIAEKQPWNLPADQLEVKQVAIRTVLEGLYILSHFLWPIIPTAIEKLFHGLGKERTTLQNLNGWNNLVVGSAVHVESHLFPRVNDSRHEQKKKAEANKAANPDQKAAAPAGGNKKGAAKEPEVSDAKRLNLRVGRIVSCKPHPTAAHLYVESIDVGEPQPRQVVSGLAKFIPLEEMQNRLIVVVCNMKPSNFQKVNSEAMVLCANNATNTVVEFVEPPKDAKVGERITIAGYINATDPAPVVLNPKKDEFGLIKPDLKTNDEKVACYKGIPLLTSAGPCTSKSLGGAQLG